MWKKICGNMYCRNSIAKKDIAERILMKGNMWKPSCENSICRNISLRKDEVAEASLRKAILWKYSLRETSYEIENAELH